MRLERTEDIEGRVEEKEKGDRVEGSGGRVSGNWREDEREQKEGCEGE
jgi:hypothetical protein